MPTTIDYVFLFFLVAVMSLVEHVWFWPWFRAGSDRPDVRVRGYVLVVVAQLAFGAVAMAIWLTNGRPLAGLSLTPPHGWRLVLAVAIVGAMGWLAWRQLRAIGRTTA